MYGAADNSGIFIIWSLAFGRRHLCISHRGKHGRFWRRTLAGHAPRAILWAASYLTGIGAGEDPVLLYQLDEIDKFKTFVTT